MGKPPSKKPSLIPVYFISSHPNFPMSPDRCHPAIQVCLRGKDMGGPIGPQERRYVAMLDTGADRNWIDGDLANFLNFPVVGKGESIITGKSVEVNMVAARICIPNADQYFGDYNTSLFRRSGLAYDVLLGMDFLRHHSLILNASRQAAKLTWLGA